MFTKHTWMSNLSTLCYITNNITGMYNIIDINETNRGSTLSMFTTKMGNLYIKWDRWTVGKMLHTYWIMKYCTMAGATCFHWPANFCKEVRYVMMKKIILFWKLLLAISCWITKLRLDIAKARRLTCLERSLIQEDGKSKRYLLS